MLRTATRALRPAIIRGQRRHFIQILSDGFLDLSIALPYPPALPPYATTIILVTALLRCSLFPVALWRRRRADRVEQFIVPEERRLKRTLGKVVFEQMKKDGIKGDKQFLLKTHYERCSAILKARKKELYTEHNCHPLPTMLVPFMAQAPPFVLLSLVLIRASTDPTPLDSESFMTLTTLSHPDSTMMIPILVGLVTVANVESSVLLRRKPESQSVSGKEQKRPLAYYLQGALKQILLGISVLRIPITILQPGSVALYWLTSATLGLVENWTVAWLSRKRIRDKN